MHNTKKIITLSLILSNLYTPITFAQGRYNRFSARRMPNIANTNTNLIPTTTENTNTLLQEENQILKEKIESLTSELNELETNSVLSSMIQQYENAKLETLNICNDIPEILKEIKVLAGISTASSAVGTLTSGGALTTGLIKSKKDKSINKNQEKIDSLENENQLLTKENELLANTNENLKNIKTEEIPELPKLEDYIKTEKEKDLSKLNELKTKKEKAHTTAKTELENALSAFSKEASKCDSGNETDIPAKYGLDFCTVDSRAKHITTWRASLTDENTKKECSDKNWGSNSKRDKCFIPFLSYYIEIHKEQIIDKEQFTEENATELAKLETRTNSDDAYKAEYAKLEQEREQQLASNKHLNIIAENQTKMQSNENKIANNISDIEYLTQKVEKETDSSKTLGNVRTGLMAGSTATSLTSTITSGISTAKFDNLIEKMKKCSNSAKALRDLGVHLIAEIEDKGENAEQYKQSLKDIENCTTFDTDNIRDIKGVMIGSSVVGGVGSATALTGTITSAIANTDKTRQNNDKATKLNLFSNIMAGVTTGTSATGTVLSSVAISKLNKNSDNADKCINALNK